MPAKRNMNIKQVLIILAFSLLLNKVNACECFLIDSISSQQLIAEVDFVVIGHAGGNVNFNAEVTGMWDNRESGFDVFIEVDSVIKGDLGSKKVIANQFGGSSCSQLFQFGEKFIIAGNQLLGFANRTPEKLKSNHGELPPPPPPSIEESIVYCYNNEQEDVDFWNALTTEYVIINTSLCSSISLNRKVAEYFLRR
jgi:hypothetical protein